MGRKWPPSWVLLFSFRLKLFSCLFASFRGVYGIGSVFLDAARPVAIIYQRATDVFWEGIAKLICMSSSSIRDDRHWAAVSPNPNPADERNSVTTVAWSMPLQLPLICISVSNRWKLVFCHFEVVGKKYHGKKKIVNDRIIIHFFFFKWSL